MNPGRNSLLARIAVLLLLCVGSLRAQEQEPPGLFHFPVVLQPSEFRSSFDINFGRVPEDIIEEASYVRAPIFIWDIRYGLPLRVQLLGTISTQIITNHFAAGVSWVQPFERFHIEPGYKLAYWFGFLTVGDGFESRANGWFNYFNLALGYDFGALTFTVKGELSIVTSLTTYAGENKTSSDNNFFNGGSVAVMMETPLWKDQYVTVGFRYNSIKFYFPTWPLFPTFNRYYYIPEVILGWRL